LKFAANAQWADGSFGDGSAAFLSKDSFGRMHQASCGFQLPTKNFSWHFWKCGRIRSPVGEAIPLEKQLQQATVN